MPTQCRPVSFGFQGYRGRKVTAAFDGAARIRCAPCCARATPTRPQARSTDSPTSSPVSAAGGPGLKILVRADSAYAREELLGWCEDHGVDYVIGVARNARLTGRIGRELASAELAARERGRAVRRCLEFLHSTCPASPTPASSSPLCPGLSPPAPSTSASTARGPTWRTPSRNSSSTLFSDRTAASRFPANQLRLLFSAFASILFGALRRALRGTRPARATAGTLSLKLFRIGARVLVSVRRSSVAIDSAHPSAGAFARVHARLPG